MVAIGLLFDGLKRLSLSPIGMTNVSAQLKVVAAFSSSLLLTDFKELIKKRQSFTIETGIVNLTTPTAASQKVVARQEEQQTVEKEANKINREVVKGSVRSGQQVYARGNGASLVILGNVSSGAEVLSDGDIVVFGNLKVQRKFLFSNSLTDSF